MVTKIFTSSSKTKSKNSISIRHVLHSEYEVLIAFLENGTTISNTYVVLDKSTAISFVNELKRQIAKIEDAPF